MHSLWANIFVNASIAVICVDISCFEKLKVEHKKTKISQKCPGKGFSVKILMWRILIYIFFKLKYNHHKTDFVSHFQKM